MGMRALITGCGSGFGYHLAERLLREGWSVVATDPDPQRLDGLVGAECHRLDLRKPEEISAVAAAAGPVDLLVNNAGYAVFGTVEEANVSTVEAMFAVNVFGLARMTQAVLPALRSRSGTVVNLSSVAGRVVFPESGFYAASKYAVEALSEALFQECAGFGLRVRVVEPGSFATRFLETARAASTPRSAQSPYIDAHENWDRAKFSVLEEPQDPAQVVDAILDSLSDARPFLRVPVGRDSERLLALRDGLSVDAWSRFAGHRQGVSLPDGFAGDPYSPAELASLTELEPERLEATMLALDTGHLAHWSEEDIATLRRHRRDPS
jgi:NAD(P)-dependent dehydrogenase (short-subunit alcohol dehydrogenase family)